MKKAYREMYTLRTARDRLGLTQKEAAKKLGISDDVLSNYERGKTLIIRKEQHRQSHKVHHLYHQLHH